MPRENNSTGLRYRGKGSLDISPKEKTVKGIFFSYGSFERSSYSSITESPAYQNPPPGAKVSYTYGIESDWLEYLTSAVSKITSSIATKLNIDLPKHLPFSLKNAQNALKDFQAGYQKHKDSIEKYFKQCSKEEQSFIRLIASHLTQHHLAQFIMTALNLNPISLAVLSILFGARGTLSQFVFHNGVPKNGTDPCLSGLIKPLICDPFYVTENGATVAQGKAQFFISSYPFSKYSPKPELLQDLIGVWPCGDRNYTINSLKAVFNNPDIQTKIGNSTLSKSSGADYYKYRDPFTPEAVVVISNEATGLSDAACAAFNKELDKPEQIASCMKKLMPKPSGYSPASHIIGYIAETLFGLALLGMGAKAIYDNRQKIKQCCYDTRQKIKQSFCKEEEPLRTTLLINQ